MKVQRLRFAWLVTLTFGTYLVSGYTQERLFRVPELRAFGWSITLFQFCVYSCMGTAEMWLRGIPRSHVPLERYVGLSLVTVATMGLSNSALSYLSYPTQLVFKSCKLIPVMVGGMVIQGKMYGRRDFLAAALLSTGLVLFNLADAKGSMDFSVIGVTLISLALCADSVIGNVQERTMKQHKTTNTEIVQASYTLGILWVTIVAVVTGELFPAVAAFQSVPVWEGYGSALLFSVMGYFGISVVLSLVKEFGATVAVGVTTLRKMITVMLSFALFVTPYSAQHVIGGLCVVAGVAVMSVKSSSIAGVKAVTLLPLVNSASGKAAGSSD